MEETIIEEKLNKNVQESSEEIYQIFDKVFKKILTLSSKAVINLINGMFGTDYPLESSIVYNWTEFVDDNLKRILADTILTINGINAYHLEAQMERDNSIVFRVFEYSYSHANRTHTEVDGNYVLRFPRPMVIYLYYEGIVPDEYTLKLEFEEGKNVYEYKVPVLKLPEISPQELSDQKMIILIPFHVLKLRYALKRGTFQDVNTLKSYILDDIIGHINKNVQLDNITLEDALKLKRYLLQLCNYLSKHHKELEGMPDMTDESFMTDIDILCKNHEEAMAKKDKQIAQQAEQIAQQQNMLKQLMDRIEKLENQQ